MLALYDTPRVVSASVLELVLVAVSCAGIPAGGGAGAGSTVGAVGAGSTVT